MSSFANRFSTKDEAVAFAQKAGRGWRAGCYHYSVKGGFYFASKDVDELSSPRVTMC